MITLNANTPHSKVTAVKNTRTAVTVPASARAAYLSNHSALTTVTLDVNPADTKATRTGTFADVGVADETITIGTTVYTLVEAVGTTAYEVLIGATAAETCEALVDAVNGNVAGGLIGAYTPPHPDVTAAQDTADIDLTAKVGGTGGNSIATTTTSAADFSWAGATMTGGANDDTAFGVYIPPRGLPVEVGLVPGNQPTLYLHNTDGATDAQVNIVWEHA